MAFINTSAILNDSARTSSRLGYSTDAIFDVSMATAIIAVNSLTLGTIFGLSGLLFDVVNIIVFYKQGLDSSINISFFVMNLSDICNLLTILWRNVCLNPYMQRTGLPLNFNEIKYLTSGWPGGCATRITAWITVYITVERLVSIATPLKVKEIVTPTKTALVIVAICTLNVVTLIPEYTTAYYGWKFYPSLNRSLIGLKYRGGSAPEMDFLCFSFHAGMAITAFTAMIVFTAILIIELKSQTRWREASTFGHLRNENISQRQRKTVIMTIAFASVMIVFYTPTAVFTVLASAWPDFSVTGKEANFYNACWSFAFLSHTINSNVNMFLFYKMSTKYRNQIHSIFSRWIGNGKETEDKVLE